MVQVINDVSADLIERVRIKRTLSRQREDAKRELTDPLFEEERPELLFHEVEGACTSKCTCTPNTREPERPGGGSGRKVREVGIR